MTFEELKAKCLEVPWTTETCELGQYCNWCLLIRPQERLYYKYTGDRLTHWDIVPGGIIDARHAQHIVRLHNMNLQLKQEMSVPMIVESDDDVVRVLLFLINDLGMTNAAITRNTGINRVTIHNLILKKIIATPKTLRRINKYLEELRQQFFKTKE
jgi:hypothetical protein